MSRLREVLVASALAAVAGGLAHSCRPAAGCAKDTDCPGELICVSAMCVEPGGAGGGGGQAGGGSAGGAAGGSAGGSAGGAAGGSAGGAAGGSAGGAAGGVAACTVRTGNTVTLAPVVNGLNRPMMLTSPPGDPRLFVIEQAGVVRVIKNGQLLATPFLDLTAVVLSGPERGLLGIAFHPGFAQNQRLYLHFTTVPSGASQVSEFLAIAGTDTANLLSRRDVLTVAQPNSNHNGGMLEFGDDGLLYIALGDGGGSGDPQDRAQDDTSLLGKLLRIDVDARTGSKPYGVPPTNPFASSADGPADPRPELWHKGLRDPVRFSFDRSTGDLYLGDPGQSWHELDAAPNAPGINWGWDDREGAHCYEPGSGCLSAGRRDPVYEFSGGTLWQAIVGGQVYRGSCFPGLAGTYFFGNNLTREVWAFELAGGQAMNARRVLGSVGDIMAIHADSAGELYVVTAGNIDGEVRRIEAQ